jgi:hypothetical protein
MALQVIRIGNMAKVHQYDDAAFPEAIETTEPIAAGDPVLTEGDHVVTVNILKNMWPIGAVFLSVVSTNPNTLMGFGTWSNIAVGQMLVGYKALDADFGTVEGTGGAKTHLHAVDVPNTASGGPSATVNAAAGGTAVGDGTHTHNVDPASVNSASGSNLPPFFVIYVWKRTA